MFDVKYMYKFLLVNHWRAQPLLGPCTVWSSMDSTANTLLLQNQPVILPLHSSSAMADPAPSVPPMMPPIQKPPFYTDEHKVYREKPIPAHCSATILAFKRLFSSKNEPVWDISNSAMNLFCWKFTLSCDMVDLIWVWCPMGVVTQWWLEFFFTWF